MADHPPFPSEDATVLAVAGNAHCTSGLLAAGRRRSQSVELPPRQLMRLRSIEEHPVAHSRRSSVVSNVAPFSRKNSLCALGVNKRLSLGPWTHYGRVSFSGLPLYQPIQEVQYENTYRTAPEHHSRFNPCRAQKALDTILRGYLGDAKYNPLSSGQLAQTLSDLIRSKLKEFSPARYKVICNVVLGQAGQQGARVCSRSLWDPQNDNFASASYSNATLFAVAMVHGVYYE